MRTDKITAHSGVAKCLQKEKGFCKSAGKNLLAALTSDCNGRISLLSNGNQKILLAYFSPSAKQFVL